MGPAEGRGPDPKDGQVGRHVRPLPWAACEGKASYLITDERGGPVSRLADAVEEFQLDMGHQVLGHAHAMLPTAPAGELRFLAECLADALGNALRIAESRWPRRDRTAFEDGA
jgi:hypothetical protein